MLDYRLTIYHCTIHDTNIGLNYLLLLFANKSPSVRIQRFILIKT